VRIRPYWSSHTVVTQEVLVRTLPVLLLNAVCHAQFRRTKIEVREMKAKLKIQELEMTQLARNNTLVVSAKSVASTMRKEAELKMRASNVRPNKGSSTAG
jgi:hypothetical protein